MHRSPGRPSRARRCAGFTLVEVTVALLLAALVVLLAHRIYGGVLDASRRLAAAREDLDREANARRLLASLVGSLAIGSSDAGGFSGGVSGVSFSAWHVGGRGWPELCRVTVGARDGALAVNGLADEALRLADSVVGLEVEYLLDLGADARWMRAWESALSAPAALRLRIAHPARTDTLLFIVGPRG
ncbi:MAG: prepilin-type N-terminal cleavage/methylation domain-containing protein [Gemmatimonadota bacterium]